MVALVGFRDGRPWLRYQGCNHGAEQSFTASAHAVHELEEAERERQLVLREASIRAQTGAQQQPASMQPVVAYYRVSIERQGRGGVA